MASIDPAEITTIVPTFQRSSLLRRAMRSVLEQDFPRLRLCVYDNASSDDTEQVVAQFMARDPRVSYHRHAANIGGHANFEFGLRRVDTPFFSILSDDDYLLPGFYRRAVAELAASPEASFWAGLTLNVDEAGRIWDARVARWPREGLYSPPEGVFRIAGGMSPTWTGILFRGEVLRRVGLPDPETRGPSDLDFVLRIAAHGSYLLRKHPVAVFSLNSSSYSSTQPLSSFWPGWQKMFRNVQALDVLDEPTRATLQQQLHYDARRMLFRRGVNAAAAGRHEFTRDAASALVDAYGASSQALVLRAVSRACESIPLAQDVFTAGYRLVERRIVRSRAGLQSQYGHLVHNPSEGDSDALSNKGGA